MDAKPTIFEFASYKFEPKKRRAFFNYKQEFKDREPISFTETLILPKALKLKGIPRGLINKILQRVHLMIGISYYKLYCSPIVRHKYKLAKEEADFWNIVYKKGLGEFFYKNGLDPKISPKFSFEKNRQSVQNNSFEIKMNDKFLVAVGGGKDSIVSAELLKEQACLPARQGIGITAFFSEIKSDLPAGKAGNSSLIDKVIDIMGVKSLKIKRCLDPKIFDEKYDFYKGHIPISAIHSFLMLLSAVLYKYSYLVVSNEFSSNFGNLEYKDQTINHQWSKSFEFENLLQEYIKKFISPDIFYFSLLRPFYEIRIAELFSKYEKYFPYFSSCNQNFKIEKNDANRLWCGRCPKCAFVFLLLSAFLDKDKLISIFKKNLFEDINLLIVFRDILGFGKAKPFDCVGTFDEAKAAIYLARKKIRDDLAGEVFLPKVDPDDNRLFLNQAGIPFRIYFKGKISPDKLIKEVFKTQPSAVPDHLKFLGMKNVLILGYGKEGQISQKYIENNFPGIKIGIADQNTDKDYLKQQENYDLAIKTPGIHKSLMEIQYTTATNIFFSRVKQLGNQIIGVTGSKGKSTTASLVCHILKKAGKNAKLLGNIGNPMLEALLKKINKNEIFVLELSSYQLDDIKFSPNIAIMTNLFPEHMDFHSGLENYYQAKKNIINFQSGNDVFIYNPKNRKAKSWAKQAKSRTIPLADEIPLQDQEIPLLGEHNRDNIRAAIALAKVFKISDKVIKKAIKSFKGLPHRLEFVGRFKGIKFYDDAISTTPESTIAAIKALKTVDTIFLGGQDRGYDFRQLKKIIKKYKIKNVVLFPENGEKILRRGTGGLNVLKTSSMEEAVKFAYRHTAPEKNCLLSCASPSYSLWKDFEEKGQQFQTAIKKLAE